MFGRCSIMSDKKRVILMVLDSVGIGEMPDAADYGDAGSNTLKSASTSPYFSMPNMRKLGYFNIDGVEIEEKEETERINSVHNLIINILSNYDGTLYIPMEYNCCEISILLLFLYKLNDIGSSKNYVISLLNCQAINYLKNKKFPFPYEDYYEALKASKSKKNTFNSSLVLECLYDWLILLNGTSDEEIDLEIYKKTFKDVSLQLWIYDCEDEIEFYKGHKNTGCCYIMPELSTFDRRKKILRKIIKEIKFKDYLSEKKKIPYISVVASRLYKMPVNPYLYLKDL